MHCGFVSYIWKYFRIHCDLLFNTLFTNLFFNFHILVDFSEFFLLLIFIFISWCPKKILLNIWILQVYSSVQFSRSVVSDSLWTKICLQSFPISLFCNKSVLCIWWPKYWSFSFSINCSNEYTRLISFRMDCLDLLAVQGTVKSLLQHHSSKASNLQCSAFFIVQLSHPYMTTGKTIALTTQTFVSKVMSLLFNMLSWLVIVFLPRSKRLLISWL